MMRSYVRSLRGWIGVILPMIALILVAAFRPSTASVVAEPAAVVALAVVALFRVPWLSPPMRRAAVAFAVVSVGSLYGIPTTLAPGYVVQWESRNGPGMDEPGPFRVQAFAEFSSLVIVPVLALATGLLAGAFVRVVPPVPWYPILLVLAGIGILVLPAEQ